MARPIALLHPTTATGRAVAAALAAAGRPLRLVGPDDDRLGALRSGLADVGTPIEVAADAPAAGTEGAEVVVAPDPSRLDPALPRLAAERGQHLLVVGADPAARRAAAGLPRGSRDGGSCLMLGLGWRSSVGEALLAVAADHLAAPVAAHVSYVAPDRGGLLAAAAPEERAELAAQLGAPLWDRVDGRPTPEELGAQRRLAWFPRPIGAHHAASFPGTEATWAAEHRPQLDTVRTYLAVTGARAELLQGVGNLARWPRPAAWLRRRVAGPTAVQGPRRTDARWACVAEVAEPGGGLARGWANGRRPTETTAAVIRVTVEALAAGAPSAATSPAALLGPTDLLDRLAALGALRWSVVTPGRTRDR